SNGLVSGTPTAAGSYSVVVTATDAMNLTGTAAFIWTVVAATQLTNPGTQSSILGIALSRPLAVTGGAAPYAWSVTASGGWGATGLPPGLLLNASTGVITGTPLILGTANVTVTVTDKYGKSSSATFTWTVL